MSIIDLLKKNAPTLEQARATVERLRDERTFATASLAEAETELSSALLAKAEGILDGAGIAKARKAVAEATQAVQESTIALAAAERRLEAAEGDNAEKEQARRRKKIAELCEHRHKLALRFQKLAVELAVVVDQVEETTSELYSIVPGRTDLAASLLHRPDLFAAMKEQLQRAQATPWSPSVLGQWEVERRPDLVARIEAANLVLGG
ncbi:MAG: hypothetical protein HYU78_00520 [Rhodocyclales bacterium]|nr:hypothetical protein [Rhodocyclales bacterium]